MKKSLIQEFKQRRSTRSPIQAEALAEPLTWGHLLDTAYQVGPSLPTRSSRRPDGSRGSSSRIQDSEWPGKGGDSLQHGVEESAGVPG
jgi:hypothetical protein